MAIKSKYYIFIIIILCVLPFITSFLTPDLLHTSDGGVQIPRMAAFYKSVRDGDIPVRWAGDLNYGYGMPLFNFIYHTPFYISTILIAIGIPLILSFKLLLFFSFILSGIGMYLFSDNFFKNKDKALFVTLLYQFAPYHLIDILTRGTIGTIYVYSLFPFMLWGLVRRQKNNRILNYLSISISTALMILSHNSMALIFFGISILFVLFFVNGTKQKILSFISLAGGLGLSAFYWIPALFEHKYTYGDLFMKDVFKVNFPSFINFFIPNPFNIQSLRVSEVAVHWGIVQTFILLAICILLFNWKKLSYESKKIIIFSFILISGSTLFMNQISTPVWEHISFLRQFQFPWRLLSVIVFATAFLGSVMYEFKWFSKNKIQIFLMILCVIATIFYWNPTQGFDRNSKEEDFWNYPLNTTYFGETDVIWSAGPAHAYPPSRIQVIEGTANVKNVQKITHMQTFTTESTQSARLVSNTQYFPGWRVYVDGKKTPIEFQDQNWRGLLTFQIPSGNHAVKIIFEETPVRTISDILTVLFCIIDISLLVVLIYKKQLYTDKLK